MKLPVFRVKNPCILSPVKFNIKTYFSEKKYANLNKRL